MVLRQNQSFRNLFQSFVADNFSTFCTYMTEFQFEDKSKIIHVQS